VGARFRADHGQLKPLSTYLVQAAMQTGIVHAAVNLSQIGYTRDASKISYDRSVFCRR
jgi:hypothetical protein